MPTVAFACVVVYAADEVLNRFLWYSFELRGFVVLDLVVFDTFATQKW